MRSTSLVAALILSGCATVAPPPQATCFHRNEAVERDIGFCAAVRAGNTLHISGVTGSGDIEGAVRKVYAQLKEILEKRGLSPAHVVKETVYAVDLDAFKQTKGIRKEFYGDWLPAATWVQVQRLYSPRLVVEIELTAEYPR